MKEAATIIPTPKRTARATLNDHRAAALMCSQSGWSSKQPDPEYRKNKSSHSGLQQEM